MADFSRRSFLQSLGAVLATPIALPLVAKSKELGAVAPTEPAIPQEAANTACTFRFRKANPFRNESQQCSWSRVYAAVTADIEVANDVGMNYFKHEVHGEPYIKSQCMTITATLDKPVPIACHDFIEIELSNKRDTIRAMAWVQEVATRIGEGQVHTILRLTGCKPPVLYFQQ